MANTADVRTRLQIFLQKQASDYVVSTLFPVMPLMGFLWAFNGDKTGHKGLGVPSADGMVISKVQAAHARQQSIMAARQYMPVIATSVPTESDVKSMSDYDTDPTVSNPVDNATLNRFTQPVFKFARAKMPYQVWHSDINTAKTGGNGVEAQAAKAVGSVYDAEVKSRMGSLGSHLNKILYQKAGNTGTGAPTDETVTEWSQYHSLQAVASASNTYAGVDRSLSANAFWRGNTDSTASYSFEDLINHCNYDLGWADVGLGVNLILVGRTGFKAAKKEAKAEGYQLISNDKIPQNSEFGFLKEVVRISSGGQWVYVCFDPTCPDQTDSGAVNHVYALNSSVWTTAIAPEGNFVVSKPADQTRVKGGEEADTGTIQAKLLLACEDPKHGIYCCPDFTF